MNEFELSKLASTNLRIASTAEKNAAISAVSAYLRENVAKIVEANNIDLEIAVKNGMTKAFLDRLTLTSDRLLTICDDMLRVALLPDPVGKIENDFVAESGIHIQKIRVPFGVIGVIYEARPNVTVDVFTLCLKTGNACLLKGGKEAKNTNEKLVEIIKIALSKTAISTDAITLLPSDRSSTEKLIKARGMVDLIVPRGGKGLINYVIENSLVPVIETGAGVCHIYVDKSAELDKAFNILKNAKMSRPSVCNAAETLLVDNEIAKNFVSSIKQNIPSLILRGDLPEQNELHVLPLLENGYKTEYGDTQLSIKIVSGVEEAVKHINYFGTHHSDCICSTNTAAINFFMNNVDSACVYSNASTRFSDGGCFGFGAELGISTQKSHARGPMGLTEMTTYFYKIYGKGEIR